jgi:hypothetical protein
VCVFIFVFVTSFLFGVNQMGKNRRGREKGIMFVNCPRKAKWTTIMYWLVNVALLSAIIISILLTL